MTDSQDRAWASFDDGKIDEPELVALLRRCRGKRAEDACDTCQKLRQQAELELQDAKSLADDYRDRLCTAEASAAFSLSRAESSERYAAERRQALLDAEKRAERAESERDRLLGVVMSSPPALTADELELMLFIRDEIAIETKPRRRVELVRQRLVSALAVLDRMIGYKPDGEQ